MSETATPRAPITVTMVSGEQLQVQTEAEARWFNSSRDNYLDQTKFSDTTDLRDLDRLLGMELQVFRMTQWLGAGLDYNGYEIDDTLLRRNTREYSEQINKTKSSMGLNKASRDDAAASGDFSAWFTQAKARAKEFGVKKEKELTRALVLMNELSSVLGAFDRSDAIERERLGLESEKDILDWIRTVMLPEFREVDEHFRTHSQKYWVRQM